MNSRFSPGGLLRRPEDGAFLGLVAALIHLRWRARGHPTNRYQGGLLFGIAGDVAV